MSHLFTASLTTSLTERSSSPQACKRRPRSVFPIDTDTSDFSEFKFCGIRAYGISPYYGLPSNMETEKSDRRSFVCLRSKCCFEMLFVWLMRSPENKNKKGVLMNTRFEENTLTPFLDKIFVEDCLAEMTRLPSSSVDMVLCDLPYGTTQRKWDAVIPFELLWAELCRIVKKPWCNRSHCEPAIHLCSGDEQPKDVPLGLSVRLHPFRLDSIRSCLAPCQEGKEKVAEKNLLRLFGFTSVKPGFAASFQHFGLPA